MSSYVKFFLVVLLFHCCNGYPIDPGAMLASSSVGLACLGIVFLILSILFFIGCACCRQNNQGFKQFSNSTTSLHQIGFRSGGRLTNEVSIFPPPGGLTRDELSPPPPRTPSPRPQAARPAGFASAISSVQPDLSHWFVDPSGHVTRQQIFYQREMGKGWFGKVVEGEARGAKVVVRILREDSTPEEKSYFLQEAQPYRDLRHRNLLSLYGKSVQQEPYLLLFDLCQNGDLKSFLVTNARSKAVLNEQGICLKMMTDIVEGLNYMHENNFIHTDLASRNCLVSTDLTIKIGDYGTSIDKYKEEYYITENVAIPIRWCAPETLNCTPTTIEAKQVTVEANVWSLGVVLWEIAEFGRLPYDELTDDQVIIRVFGSEKLRLSQPDCPYGVFLYNVLGLCWRITDRAGLSHVLSMIYYLRNSPGNDKQVDFDSRWSQMKPNTIPRIDNHPLANSREFDSGVDLEMKSCRSLTLSATSDDFLQSKKSASLTNLQGSLEDVREVQNTEENLATEEDVKRPLMPSFRLGPVGGKSDSSSDTEEETWRTRIERGEFTEKVKEKSKSVTDLMVLTHIDSEGSESDSLPSLQPKQRNNSKPAYTSIGFGSEGNIHDALLSEELHSALRQIIASRKPDQPPFLGKVASEINTKTPFANSRPLPPIPSVDTLKQVVNKNNIDLPICSDKQIPLVKTDAPSRLSSQSDVNIPEITVTEASFIDTVSESDPSSYLPDVKPRKLMIVCRDEESSSSDEEMASDTSSMKDDIDLICNKLISFNCTPSKVQDKLIMNSQDIILPPSEFVDLSEKPTPLEYSQSSDIINLSISNDVVNLDKEETKNDLNIVCFKSEIDSSVLNDISTPAEIPFIKNISEPEVHQPVEVINQETRIELPDDEESEPTVILGSCEDYTLEYFKGLKTTYAPPDSFSDGGSDRPDEVGEDSDFINDESQTSQVDGSKTADFGSRPKPVRQDSYEDPYPDSMSASVTTVSSSSGYATIEKDKIIRNDYNYIEESFSPAKDKLQSEESAPNEFFLVKTLTENFLSAEKEFSSVNLSMNADEYKIYCVSLESAPKFMVDEVVSQDPFVIESCNYGSYFSDSGEGSSSQQDEIKELKTRLEDAMKLNNDYHLKKTDEEYACKIVTPDDERSSDSGFRDKGSLSESAEDTCDEKYNLEDIDTELDDFAPKHMDCSIEEETKQHPGGEGWFLHPRDKSGWLPESTEFEVIESVALNADFINAIRCELREKLPQAGISLEEDEDSSPEEVDCMEADTGVFTLPIVSQLSPILEERESNQSSLILDDISPADTPDINNRLDLTYDVIDCSKKDSLMMDDMDDNEEDVLVVDVETNEATLIESPKAQNGLVFSSFQPLNSEDDHSEDTLENYAIQRESTGFTPDISLGSSSPDQGNLSGFFMSPCSVRSDLFDSGPPSLPFDITQSLDETEETSPATLPDLVTSSMNNSILEPQSPDTLKLYSPLDDSISKSFDSTIKNIDTSTEESTLISGDDTIIRNDCKRISDFLESDVLVHAKNHNCTDNEDKQNKDDIFNMFESNINCCDRILDNMEVDSRNGNDEKKKELEKEIDLLIMNNNNSRTDLSAEEEEMSRDAERDSKNGWLEEILAEKSTGLEGNGWPSVDELVVKPCLSSTIALASPGDPGDHYPQMPLTPCSEPGDSGWRPTITQLMDLAANEPDEMTTSFIEPCDGTSTPDWDSDTSESSSSGEFIWKEGDKEESLGHAQTAAPLSDSSDEGKMGKDRGDDESSCDDSSEEGSCSSEFVPSIWDSSLIPSKSSIRCPSSILIEAVGEDGEKRKKKKVVFKKEKYQCIYEYPREPSDDEDDQEPAWKSLFKISMDDYFDWEKERNEAMAFNDEDPFQLFDSELLELYGKHESGSEFFPGELDEMDSGDEFTPLASDIGESAAEVQDTWPQERLEPEKKDDETEEESSASQEESSKAQTPLPLGVLRHTKDQLKLDLRLQPQTTVNMDIRGEANILDCAAVPPTD